MNDVVSNQEELFDPELYKHHLLLLKSAHCCRPVLYRGLKQFIHTLTMSQDGGSLSMTVYLAGITGGMDSAEIQIMSNPMTDPDRGAFDSNDTMEKP